ncbi:MAG: hypothetical protein GY757_07930 [bacterium]|nr:hypothetical protein [bacterium]
MGIKEIFNDGMREFKRQSALRKEKKDLSSKEKIYSEQQTSLGRKAWDSKLNIDGFGNSKDLLSKAQGQIDDLDSQLGNLEAQNKELEEKKTKENDAFNLQRSEVEEKKREVDSRINEAKTKLKEEKKALSSAESRLKQIDKETRQLDEKVADPQTPSEEKNSIPNRRTALAAEKNEVEQKQATATANSNALEEKLIPIEEESDSFQKEIDAIKDKQREEIGKLEDSISHARKDISQCKENQATVSKEQNRNFEELGEKIAAVQTPGESIAQELAVVNATKKELEELQVGIQSLEHQGSAASRSALWKMIGLIAAGIGIIAAIILLLVMLLGPKDEADVDVPTTPRARKKVPEPAAGAVKQMGNNITGAAKQSGTNTPNTTTTTTGSPYPVTPKTLQEAGKSMQSMTGAIKEQSEKIQGQKITVADKETFLAALPDISGWKRGTSSYEKGSFGQIESANLSANYTTGSGQQLNVTITDAGTASVILSTYKTVFNLNISRQNEKGYSKITTYNNIPVIENFTKSPPQMSMVFIIKDRYLVELKCKSKNPRDALKTFISEFQPDKLQ